MIPKSTIHETSAVKDHLISINMQFYEKESPQFFFFRKFVYLLPGFTKHPSKDREMLSPPTLECSFFKRSDKNTATYSQKSIFMKRFGLVTFVLSPLIILGSDPVSSTQQ